MGPKRHHGSTRRWTPPATASWEDTWLRTYRRQNRKSARARVDARQEVANSKYSYKEEVSKKEGKRILQEERFIRNPRIVEVSVELAEVACRNLKIPMNAHVFTHGIQK